MSAQIQEPIDLASLRVSQGVLEGAVKAKRTRQTYSQWWKTFSAWCEAAGQQALPASPETLRLYMTWALSARGYRLDTVKVTLTAIVDRHRSEGYPSPATEEIWRFLETCRRHLKEEPRGRAPLTIEQIKQIAALPCESLRDKRDRAAILLGFACGWRRSELVRLECRDISFVEEGVILRLRQSKTDQAARGRQIGIRYGKTPETCPVRALQAWMEVRGESPGPVFVGMLSNGHINLRPRPMQGAAICQFVQRALQRIGVDPKPYGAHSLRAGFVTKAAELGSSELSIMQYTGHRSIQTVMRYIRPAQAFRFNPIDNVL